MKNPFKIGQSIKHCKRNICGIVECICNELVGMRDSDGIICRCHKEFELVEPPAKFADVKVGDWVEIETTDGQTKQHQVTHVTNGHSMFSIDNDVYFLTKNGGMVHMSNNAKAIRIVPPSEVIVDFGAFKGTVEGKDSCSFYVNNADKSDYCLVSYDMLSEPILEQVRQLIEAQGVKNG